MLRRVSATTGAASTPSSPAQASPTISASRALSSRVFAPLGSVTWSAGPDGAGGFGGGLFGTLPGPLVAIQYIGTGHLVMLAAHQRQFDLVLHILDMKGAALAGAPRQRVDDFGAQLLDDFVHAAGGGRRVSLDRQERLGHRHRNLAGVESGNRAVAPMTCIGVCGSGAARD